MSSTYQTSTSNTSGSIIGPWHNGQVTIGDSISPNISPPQFYDPLNPFSTGDTISFPVSSAAAPVTSEEIEQRMKEREEAHHKEMDEWQLQLDAAIQLEKDALLEERECAECGELKKHDPSDYICLDCRG